MCVRVYTYIYLYNVKTITKQLRFQFPTDDNDF